MSVDNYSGASNAPVQHESHGAWRQTGQQWSSLSWVYSWRRSETQCKRENREGAKAWWSVTIHRVPWHSSSLPLPLKPHIYLELPATNYSSSSLQLPFNSMSFIVESIMVKSTRCHHGKHFNARLKAIWLDLGNRIISRNAATLGEHECATRVYERVWTRVLKGYMAFTLVRFMVRGCEE